MDGNRNPIVSELPPLPDGLLCRGRFQPHDTHAVFAKEGSALDVFVIVVIGIKEWIVWVVVRIAESSSFDREGTTLFVLKHGRFAGLFPRGLLGHAANGSC